MWCDGGGRHWWVLTTWVVIVVCGRIISVRGRSFSNVGGHFRTWAVVFECGRSFSNVGGCSRTWAVVVWWWWWRSAVAGLSTWLPCRCQRRGTWLPCQQRKWGEGVFTDLLVVVAASDVAPRCRWQGGGVGCSLPLVPLVGGVLSSCRCCGCGCGESSLLLVVAADVAFLHRSDGVPACPGGCRWWAVVWRRWVGVVGGCREWVS